MLTRISAVVIVSFAIAIFCSVNKPRTASASNGTAVQPSQSPTVSPSPTPDDSVLHVKENYASITVGQEKVFKIVNAEGNGVNGVTCRVFGEPAFDVRIPVSQTNEQGEIKIIAQRPAVGLIVKCSKGKAEVEILITELIVEKDGSICSRLEEKRSIADQIGYFRENHKDIPLDAIRKILNDCERDRIEVSPSILDYKTVRANYGKGVGDNFIVIQINVQNKSGSSKFFLQNAQAALDPKRCDLVSDYFDEIYLNDPKYRENIALFDKQIRDATTKGKPNTTLINELESDQKIRTEAYARAQKSLFKVKCVDKFVEHFQYPITLGAISRDKVIGLAKNELYKSPRKIGFQIANFVSAMTPVLSGLNFLGRDGKIGFGFLGTTIIPEADKGIPDVSKDKMEQLQNSIKTGEIVIDPGKSETINIFVEARYFFDANGFKQYRMEIKKLGSADLEFNRLLKLFLIASVDGIMIPNDAPTVKSKQGGGILVEQTMFRNL